MAVTLTAQELAYRMRLIADTEEAIEEPQLTVVNAVLDAATALVVRYAPSAPNAVHDEAATRLAGCLYDTPPSGSRQWQNPMQQSGATAVLSSFRVLRARIVGGDDVAASGIGGLRLHGQANVAIPTRSVWTATGLSKPGTAWWVYQIAVSDSVSPAIWMPLGALAQTSTAGSGTDISDGYVVGCDATGELLLAGPDAGVTATLTVWSLEG